MKEEAMDYFNKAVTQAMSQGYERGYNEGYEQGYQRAWEDAWERQHSPSDARNSESRDNIPLEELRAEIGGLQDCIDDLEGRVKRVEAVVFYGGKSKT